jgi:hypothetical protein
MISGTSLRIEDPRLIAAACRGLRPGVATASEIREIEAECALDHVLCVSCEDGMAVFGLEATEEGLELFVWIAVAFRHGCFERQEAALRAIARDLGANAIAFRSRRRGWARRLGPEWVRRGSEEFVRCVDE